MIIYINILSFFTAVISSSPACDCSCHANPHHPIWHGFRVQSTHCEAVWGSSQYSCPNVVGDAWKAIARGEQTCNLVGNGGCCNRRCCNGSGPNPKTSSPTLTPTTNPTIDPLSCGPLFGGRSCSCSQNGWNTYCDEAQGKCGRYRSFYDASSGAFDCATNQAPSMPTGCLQVTTGAAAGIYKVDGLFNGKYRYVHKTNPAFVISWIQHGRHAWHISHNGAQWTDIHWYHDRDEYGINVGFDGNPAAGLIPGIPDLSAFSNANAIYDYVSEADGCVARPRYEVDYGNGNGWMPATTILTNNLESASDQGGNYKWREVSEKLNNKASIAFGPYAKLEITAGQTMKIRCQNTCEVYYMWLDKIALCTRYDNEATCRPKLAASPNRPSSYASLLTDWKDEGVDVVAQQYTPLFVNYDLTKNPTGNIHGFYLINMAAKSKVLKSEEITVGPATSEGAFWVAFLEIERATKNPTSSPTHTPTINPTKNPTSAPTRTPTSSPTRTPTINPTSSPTRTPTSSPTLSPSSNPSMAPTLSPSPMPTAKEFMMKIKGFHGSPESSLARIVFAQERAEVKKIDFDEETIKTAQD